MTARAVFARIARAARRHQAALLAAFLVGGLYIAPHVWFIVSLGDEYKGIPLLQTQNEDYYLARIREVIEGHYSIGSFTFYEYKDAPPLTPPTIEFLYALPSFIFEISPFTTAIVSRFFLPGLLFLLVYSLILRLTVSPRTSLPRHAREKTAPENISSFSIEGREGENAPPPSLSSPHEGWRWKMNAIAGALFVTLGYDLVNYRGIWRFFTGDSPLSGSFLVWSRLVHPIWGALFLFSFLLLLWSLIQKTKYRKSALIGASACSALMFSSYFFSWGVALSVWGALLLIYFLKKEYAIAKDLLLTMGGAVLLSGPYWISVWLAAQDPLYEEAVLRSGLFLTHYPLVNKFMLAVFVLYVCVVWLLPFCVSKITRGPTVKRYMEPWQWFTLALILGSLWVYVQQVVTGRTIWPYHFPQYTIPLGIAVFMALYHNLIRPRLRYVWLAGTLFIIATSVVYGVAVQATVYRNVSLHHADTQKYAPLFEFLSSRGGACVVLSRSNPPRSWNYFITAFTPCDVYTESGVSILLPFERVYHNYLVTLRFRGVRSDTVEDYLRDNPLDPLEYLFSNWKGLYSIRDFPDFSDALLAERMRNLPGEYRNFLKMDLKAELKKYRLDYILSIGPLNSQLLKELSGTELVRVVEDMYLYEFR